VPACRDRIVLCDCRRHSATALGNGRRRHGWVDAGGTRLEVRVRSLWYALDRRRKLEKNRRNCRDPIHLTEQDHATKLGKTTRR
jgi:hypothetical protein